MPHFAMLHLDSHTDRCVNVDTVASDARHSR